jgi:hypothetical protein
VGTWRPRRATAQAPADHVHAQESLDRATAMLRRYQRSGVTVVEVADVLRVLGADPETDPPPMAQYLEPGTDPLTGCRSVTPG